jgi:hypothetical protein
MLSVESIVAISDAVVHYSGNKIENYFVGVKVALNGGVG